MQERKEDLEPGEEMTPEEAYHLYTYRISEYVDKHDGVTCDQARQLSLNVLSEIIAAVRERCAKIAEDYGTLAVLDCGCASTIAEKIREGK